MRHSKLYLVVYNYSYKEFIVLIRMIIYKDVTKNVGTWKEYWAHFSGCSSVLGFFFVLADGVF